MLAFTPRDNFEKQLLKSIPKKVAAWLDNIGEQTHGAGGFGDLSWSFDIDTSFIQVRSTDTTIAWRGAAGSPTWIAGSDPRFEDISNNIDFFVSVEKLIYDELEKLQSQLDEQRMLPELDASRPQE